MSLLLSDSGKIGIKNGKIAIAGPGGTECCCDVVRCCGRLLPSVLYLNIINVPVGPDPLPPFNFSNCCADGLRVPLYNCQNIPATEDPPFQGGPNIWRTAIGGADWCGSGILYAEWQCTLPGGGDCESADVLRIYIDDDCDDQFFPGEFVCPDTCPGCTILRSLTASDRTVCICGDGESTFFHYEYETLALFGQCCNNAATNGPRLRWIVEE